jgi:3D (Asp-Asp-Asp) domain-containing protein
MFQTKTIEKYLFAVAVISLTLQLVFPQYSLAQAIEINNIEAQVENIEIKIQPTQVVTVTMTAYSSTIDQCDSTPFITASGTHVHDGTIAANFLPIGTKVKIPSVFGDKIFTVEDRMNARYYKRLDIWFETRQEALNFGIQTLEVEVYE